MQKGQMLPTLTITIPVLNEEKTLAKKINILQNYIDKKLSKIVLTAIVIADNGSEDDTLKIAKNLSEKNRNISFLTTKERGVGLALKSSWKSYPSDIMGYMDLDLATDLSHINDAVDMILNKQHKIIAGSRLLEDSEVIGRKAIRTFTSIVFNKLVKVLFKTKFTDGMCGFKFFHKDILNKLGGIDRVNSDGWFFATEFLILSERKNYQITDLPVKWTDDNSSKVKIVRLSIQYLREMVSLKRRIK